MVADVENEGAVPQVVLADPLAVEVHISVLIHAAEGHEHRPTLLGFHLNPGAIPSPFVVVVIVLILPGLANVDLVPARIVEVRGGVGAGLLRMLALLAAEFPLHGHLRHLFMGVGDHRRRVGVVVVVLIRSVMHQEVRDGPDALLLLEVFELLLDQF